MGRNCYGPKCPVTLSPIRLCGCGQEVGHCESLILYHKDLYIFVEISQVTFSYSSLDTFINTNNTPKGGAPVHRRNIHPRKKGNTELHRFVS